MRRAIGNHAGFVHREAAAQDFALAIAEPFLDHLVAADRVLPNADRNILPVGEIVQVHIQREVAEQLDWSAERPSAAAPSAMASCSFAV